MKSLKITIVLLFALSLNNFAQTVTDAFEVVKSGKGAKSIILIPGFASAGEVWDETKSKFEQGYTCYTLTMAGFAGVTPQENPTFKNWETSIANYIKTNNIEKPIIIGHSMGGVFAMALAADYPDLIEKIIVVDALPCISALMNPTFKSVEKPDCTAMVQQITSASNDQFYQMQKMSAQRLVADTTKQELILNWSLQSDRKTFAEMYCDFANVDLRESIKNIKCPSLILLEDYFKNIKPSIEAQYKNLQTADLQYSTKGLHFIMYDDKDWYFNQLQNFLNGI
ncbi:alpha/beta fold hydrolase [Chondrinema litorale]|uniref:alpha/beta fold hydrolase n=1 Tax=Chondrinema litorale TaxID=2994555 RepID=UPI0025432BB5|nr:alpha/beta hydrolase [Chondrinema litorale]UZR98840.1 alpha/beta hydrolase [Chondrinema litorale]